MRGVLWASLLWTHVSACPCSTVQVSLTGDALTAQAFRAGAYDLVPGIASHGQPVYGNSAYGHYLFLCPSTENWLIGTDITTCSYGIKSSTNQNASCPVDAGGWLYFSDGTTFQGTTGSSSIEVTCPAPSAPPAPSPAPSAPPSAPCCSTVYVHLSGDALANHGVRLRVAHGASTLAAAKLPLPIWLALEGSMPTGLGQALHVPAELSAASVTLSVPHF